MCLSAGVAGCDREASQAPAPTQALPQTIARAVLFGDPARSAGQLSPRGDRVAFLAPRDGVLNLWVLSVDAMDQARPLTDERSNGGVRQFLWARDNSTLVYSVDVDGNETWRLFAVDAAGETPSRALTPAGARAEILGMSDEEPGTIVVSLTERGRVWPDVVKIDLASATRTLVLRNPGGFTRFAVDGNNQVRLGVRSRDDGGAEIAVLSPNGRWRTVSEIPFEDALSSQLIALDPDGASFLMFDSAGRDRTALVRVDIATGAKTVLGESERADVVDLWLDPTTGAPEAFATEYLRREWRALDPEAQADLAFLDEQLDADFHVVSRSADDARWIVVEAGPTTSPRSYLYDRVDRAGRRFSLLFRHRPDLETAPLQPMAPVEIAARDGLTLVSYVTLPIGADENGDARPERPAPLVIAPMSAPWTRSSFGFDALHQWLANRGYAVMSVNTRGSSGFGKAFLNAGNGEWGGRMQEDLLDAAQWAVASGVAEADRIAIVGSGFGGYAALAGMTFAPETYRCGASFGGFANLFTRVDAAPPAERAALYARVGDPRSAEGRQVLRERSPLFNAARIRNPMLLAMGGRDMQASRSELDLIAQAIRPRRNGLTYMVFPNEGRSLLSIENRLSYFAVLEHFLGDCLGGRVEPVGAALEGAEIEVFDGAVNVPGLSAFARRLPGPQAPEPALRIYAPGEGPDDVAPPDEPISTAP
ncbi:MAG: prolyl oligopeptidase family serine peptidase [Hyphomonadaceae bacterium]|nr:prolyl oligopeptidase family serine peptidase [Hyphomonadaceae bacterium]